MIRSAEGLRTETAARRNIISGSQYERRLISQRARDALAAKRARGERLGAAPALPLEVTHRIIVSTVLIRRRPRRERTRRRASSDTPYNQASPACGPRIASSRSPTRRGPHRTRRIHVERHRRFGCSRIRCTALTFAPADTARLAAVCRRSCGVIEGHDFDPDSVTFPFEMRK